MQKVYKANLAIFENNVSLFEQRAKQISKEPLHTYYIAYSEALKGNFEAAQALKEKLSVGWMPYAIDAIIAKEQGDLSAFRIAPKESIHLARGVQKFNLFYSFEWMDGKRDGKLDKKNADEYQRFFYSTIFSIVKFSAVLPTI